MKTNVAKALHHHVMEMRLQAEDRLRSLQESLLSEAKSSAGDKHETGRAMIHQEMAQVIESLQRCEDQIQMLRRWAKSKSSPTRVASGVLIETEGPMILVGVPIGKVQFEGRVVLSISSEAPAAKASQGLRVGDVIKLGPQSWKIVRLH